MVSQVIMNGGWIIGNTTTTTTTTSSSSSSSSSSLDDDVDDVTRLASALEDCIYRRDLEGARQLVENLTPDERRAASRHRPDGRDGRTLLYSAVSNGDAQFVRFVLEECHADIEQVWFDGETSLCIASYRPLDDVVPVLIEHGAQVNATGYEQSTPLHLASGTNDPNLVRYLVERGADVRLPDVNGQTCLMRSIAYATGTSITQYLIKHGSFLNATDNLGDSALHYAVKPRLSTVRDRKHIIIDLLQRHGADSSIRNQSGDDALQTAALHGTPETIDYVIDKLHPTAARCADLYSLVAARYVDEVSNFEGAMDLWKEAVNIRLLDVEPTPRPNPVYNGAVEARDMQSLNAMADDRDALCMQALICRERILGSGHCETIHWLSNRALQYASSNAFQRGIEMYRYAAASCGPASINPYRGMYTHGQFVWLLMQKVKHDPNSVRFDDAEAVLRILVKTIKHEVRLSLYMTHIEYIREQILGTAIDAVDLLCRLRSSIAESRCLRRLVRELVQSKCKTWNEGNALHVALDGNLVRPPSCALVEELLEAGVDVNGTTSDGDTPLHLAVLIPNRCLTSSNESDKESWLDLLNLLLRHGSHADMRNAAGKIAADRLPAGVDKVRYSSLQCLAARAIRQHGVPYHDVLPPTLVDFVRRH